MPIIIICGPVTKQFKKMPFFETMGNDEKLSADYEFFSPIRGNGVTGAYRSNGEMRNTHTILVRKRKDK